MQIYINPTFKMQVNKLEFSYVPLVLIIHHVLGMDFILLLTLIFLQNVYFQDPTNIEK